MTTPERGEKWDWPLIHRTMWYGYLIYLFIFSQSCLPPGPGILPPALPVLRGSAALLSPTWKWLDVLVRVETKNFSASCQEPPKWKWEAWVLISWDIISGE